MNSNKIARWNSDSTLYLHMVHPVHGKDMDLALRSHTPTVIDTLWLNCTDFIRRRGGGEDARKENTISVWDSTEIPVSPKIDFSDLGNEIPLTPDLKESLRQIIHGPITEERDKMLQIGFGGRNWNTSYRFMTEVYDPWLKRVKQEEARFQNRQHIIELCDKKLDEIRAMK